MVLPNIVAGPEIIVSVTGKPELADASTVNGALFTNWFGILAKLIAWLVELTVKLCVSVGAAKRIIARLNCYYYYCTRCSGEGNYISENSGWTGNHFKSHRQSGGSRSTDAERCCPCILRVDTGESDGLRQFIDLKTLGNYWGTSINIVADLACTHYNCASLST